MPIKQAAKKAMRHSKRRQSLNIKVKTKVRSALKEARTLIHDGKKKEATAAVDKAIKELDRALSKGTYKKNTVSRTKSRLHKALAKTGSEKKKTNSKPKKSASK